MQYNNICRATFLERPNRFVANVLLEDREVLCHVKNTGRCRELLIPGATVILQSFLPSKRRTNHDLIAVYKGERLINMDSQAPNKAVGEWLSSGGLFAKPSFVQPEQRFGASRFDFYLESHDGRRAFLEVKGVTLEENGIALFPDAPTERGIKHLLELQSAMRSGYEAYVLFLVQMKGVSRFKPNAATHPAFAETLRQVQAAGVEILAYDCLVTPNSLTVDRPLPISL